MAQHDRASRADQGGRLPRDVRTSGRSEKTSMSGRGGGIMSVGCHTRVWGHGGVPGKRGPTWNKTLSLVLGLICNFFPKTEWPCIPPFTPCGIFCRGMSPGISLPICRFARTRVCSGCDVDRRVATPQTPIRSTAPHGYLAMGPRLRPLARHGPQTTLGTLPCPIVMITVDRARPQGATPTLAHGRGVANT
jgi:hypothetical protein